jgi:hypothetical protein
MPKKDEDKPVVLHPLTFEEALKRMVSTPLVNPAKRKKQRRKCSRSPDGEAPPSDN